MHLIFLFFYTIFYTEKFREYAHVTSQQNGRYLHFIVHSDTVSSQPGQAFRAQETFGLPEFREDYNMKTVRLPAVCSSHLYPEEISLVLVSVTR
jgi:hypothetical protein